MILAELRTIETEPKMAKQTELFDDQIFFSLCDKIYSLTLGIGWPQSLRQFKQSYSRHTSDISRGREGDGIGISNLVWWIAVRSAFGALWPEVAYADMGKLHKIAVSLDEATANREDLKEFDLIIDKYQELFSSRDEMLVSGGHTLRNWISWVKPDAKRPKKKRLSPLLIAAISACGLEFNVLGEKHRITDFSQLILLSERVKSRQNF